MPKVLISIPWFTPAFRAGGPIQSVLNMVNSFDNSLHYNIICGDTDIENVKLDLVDTNKWIEFNKQTKVHYTPAKNRVINLLNLYKKTNADVLFIIGIYSFYFTIIPILFSRSSRIVLSVRGMLHPPALQQKSLKKKIYLGFLKPILKLKKVSFHATDEDEALHIRKIIGVDATVWVAPNIPKLIEPTSSPKVSGSLKILTVALVSPMKNYLKILQALSECKEDIIYDICGPIFDANYWLECKEVIRGLPSNIKVTYHGAVAPESLTPFYQNADVFICPSQSENFGHAIFEAFSAGLPVITSNNTPWNNLEELTIGLNINPTKEAIIKSLQHFILINNDEFLKWKSNAANFARKSILIESAKEKYLNMFSGIVK
jgi:glycosyltransferase involved in cell wall biosynthesis